MQAPRRPGRALLVGLAAGAVLMGVLDVVVPAGLIGTGFQAAAAESPAASAVAQAPPSGRPVPAPETAAPTTTTPVPTQTAPTSTTVVEPTAAPTTRPPDPEPPRPVDPEPSAEPEPTDPGPADSGPAAAVVTATDAERVSAGCGALRVDDRLTAAAQGHADDMSRNGYFSHTSQDGREFDDRILAEGYPSPGGENIAAGQRTAAEVTAAWMDSPGHRRNILDCAFTSIGVGYAADGNYWVQNFGR